MANVLISLQVAGRNLPLNVPPEEKELVEKAALLLNKKINDMSGSSVDAEMRLLMSALSLSGDYLRLKEQWAAAQQGEQPAIFSAASADLDRRLEEMSAQLEAALSAATDKA